MRDFAVVPRIAMGCFRGGMEYGCDCRSATDWPYFVPGTKPINYMMGAAVPARRILVTDGTGGITIPGPGGFAAAHISLKANGSELFHGSRTTRYYVVTGATGRLNLFRGAAYDGQV